MTNVLNGVLSKLEKSKFSTEEVYITDSHAGFNAGISFAIDIIEKILENSSYISVAEKTGRWIDGTDCSCCGFTFYDDVTNSKLLVGFKYCPNCGAKMGWKNDK